MAGGNVYFLIICSSVLRAKLRETFFCKSKPKVNHVVVVARASPNRHTHVQPPVALTPIDPKSILSPTPYY